MVLGNKFKSFWTSFDVSQDERRPLLPQKSPGGDSGSAAVEVDAIDQLEGLPLLLTRAVAVYTMALVGSTITGAFRAGVSRAIPRAVVMVPVLIAHVWLVHELAVSVKWVRRTMIEEERKRRISLRRITASRRRAALRPTPPTPLDPTAAPTYAISDAGVAAPPTSLVSRADSRVTVTKAVGAAIVATTASVVAGNADPAASAATQSPEISPRRESLPSVASDRGGVASNEGEQKTQSGRANELREGEAGEQDRAEESDTCPGGGGNDEGVETGTSKDDEVLVSRDALFSPPSQLAKKLPESTSSSPLTPRGSLPEQRRPERDGMTAVSARAVRISYLLQAWVRLWLTMSAFAIVTGILLLLLFLRFLGVSQRALSASAIASPAVLALAALAVHSIIMLDGDGGTAGGAAVRGGGSRSSLALGRRPIILLSLICAIVTIGKLDAEESSSAGEMPMSFQALCDRLSWAVALSPVSVAAALVEGVYLRALWENRTGRNCGSVVFGSSDNECRGRWLGSSCCEGCYNVGRGGESDSASGRHSRVDDRSDYRRRPRGRNPLRRLSFHTRPRGMSNYSTIRRRAVLTQSQRAAAAAIAGGILFLFMSMVGCSLRKTQTLQASWAVPMTMLVAAAAEGLIGAGLWRLVSENCRAIRGGVPPSAKPLPVLYSEREGGWIVGPADPPTVSIFLLGEVVLRQESFGGENERWAPAR